MCWKLGLFLRSPHGYGRALRLGLLRQRRRLELIELGISDILASRSELLNRGRSIEAFIPCTVL